MLQWPTISNNIQQQQQQPTTTTTTNNNNSQEGWQQQRQKKTLQVNHRPKDAKMLATRIIVAVGEAGMARISIEIV